MKFFIFAFVLALGVMTIEAGILASPWHGAGVVGHGAVLSPGIVSTGVIGTPVIGGLGHGHGLIGGHHGIVGGAGIGHWG